jgi:hypothetical protein
MANMPAGVELIQIRVDGRLVNRYRYEGKLYTFLREVETVIANNSSSYASSFDSAIQNAPTIQINENGGVGNEQYGPEAPIGGYDGRSFSDAIAAATPAYTFPTATAPQPPTATRPVVSAPVDTRTADQRLSDFYAAAQTAIDAAKAGDPTPLRNFDRMFGITRNPAEYSQSFYYGSSPSEQINLINNMQISQEMKTKVIAERLAIQAGARGSDSVDNIVAWFNAGGPEDPRTVAYTGSSAQNRINVVNATNLSQQAKVNIITEILSGNPDSVVNMVTYHGVHGLGMSPTAANWASSATPENQIAVVNATNISQDSKNRVIAEIQAGSNLSDTVYDKISWIERGNPPSAAALAILNPPPPAVTAPEPAPVVEASASETESSTTRNPNEVEASAPESSSDSQSGSGEFIDSIKPVGTEIASDATSNSDQNTENESMASGNSEEHRQDEEAHAKALAAQAEADEKQAAALAIATVNKASAKESRLKKIMAMRKPWSSGGATNSTGTDSMVAPVITPSSQLPPPPL